MITKHDEEVHGMNTYICYDVDEGRIWNAMDETYLNLEDAISFLENLRQAVTDMEIAISEMSNSPFAKRPTTANPDGHNDDF